MTNQAIAKIVEGNWDQLKGQVKKQWGKLTHDELSNISGSYDSLVGKVKEHYGYTLNDAELEVNNFLKKTKNFKDNAEEDAESVSNDLLAKIHDSLESYKDQLKDVEANMTNLVKNNPLKTVGIAALVGFAVAKLVDITR